MIRKRVEKTFDCVGFKRQAQARIHEKIKDLSPEEEIAHIRRVTDEGPFGELLKQFIARKTAHSSSGPESGQS